MNPKPLAATASACRHFPEIHTQGEDVDDALAMAREAIELSIAVRKDEGDDLPAPSGGVVRIERVVSPVE